MRIYGRFCIRSLRESMIISLITTEWITGKCIEKQHNTRNHIFALQQSHVHYEFMICVNLIFPIGLSQCRIVYQIMLLLILP